MRTRWVIAADEQRARIFAHVEGIARWQDIRSVTRAHIDSREPGREVRLPEARPGKPVNDSDFAARLARELSDARKRGDFDELIITAKEPFLSHLQESLDVATRRKVKGSEAIDLLSLPLSDARKEISRRW